MYELTYGGQTHQFADEATAHSFLQVELNFKDTKAYNKMFTEFTKTPSNVGLSPAMYNFVNAMPEELRGLMDELRKASWKLDNQAAREAWEAGQAEKKKAQTANFTAMQATELEAIKQDEQGRWLVDHPGSTPLQFEAIWPLRLQQLEKEWGDKYYKDKMNQLRSAGGIF